MNMRNTKLLTLAVLLAAGLGKEAVANDSIDDRLYVAPSLSYINLDNDREVSNDAYGLNLGLGKAMNEKINVELKTLLFCILPSWVELSETGLSSP